MSNRYVYNSYNYYQRNHGGYSRNPRVINNQRTVNTRLEKEIEEYNTSIQTKRDEDNQKIGEQQAISQVLETPLVKSLFIDSVLNFFSNTVHRFSGFTDAVQNILLGRGQAILYYFDTIINEIRCRVIGAIKALGALSFYSEYGELKNYGQYECRAGHYLKFLHPSEDIYARLVTCSQPTILGATADGEPMEITMPSHKYFIGNAHGTTAAGGYDSTVCLTLPELKFSSEPLYFSSEFDDDDAQVELTLQTNPSFWKIQNAEVIIPLSNVTDTPSLDDGGVLPLPT